MSVLGGDIQQSLFVCKVRVPSLVALLWLHMGSCETLLHRGVDLEGVGRMQCADKMYQGLE